MADKNLLQVAMPRFPTVIMPVNVQPVIQTPTVQVPQIPRPLGITIAPTNIPKPTTPGFVVPRPVVPTILPIVPKATTPGFVVPRPVVPTIQPTTPVINQPVQQTMNPQQMQRLREVKGMLDKLLEQPGKARTQGEFEELRQQVRDQQAVPTVRPTIPPAPIIVLQPTTLTIQPTIPRPTIPQPTALTIQPTIPQPIALTIPKPVMQTTNIPQPIATTPRAQIVTPDNIDEDTIIEIANTYDRPTFEALLKMLGDHYHNDMSLVGDEIYDELVDIYEAKFGAYTVVGAEPTGAKVPLPYYLGSLRKLKEEAELNRWLQAHPGPYLIEDKIDGSTILLVSQMVNGQRVTKLYTRGGGVRGKDVSHLLGHVPFPRINEDIAVRGEMVLTRQTFARVGTGMKNARNMANGLILAEKQFNPTLARELSFFAYRILTKNNTPEQDINELRTLGFQVPNPVSAPTLTKEILTNYFQQRKKEAPYEMDGLVVYQNLALPYPEGDAPRHVVAFKTGSETAVTTVTSVTWKASKDRRLKPVVNYEVTNLSGADLGKASGYNGKFIVMNNIGPGARILLTRSGDVIPKILSVIEPAPGGPDWPSQAIHGRYDWNDNQVELVVFEDNDEVVAGKLKHFIETVGVKNMGPARIKLMVQAGIKSIAALLTVTPQQLATIQGIGPTLSNQFYTDIHARTTNIPLAKIMDASGIFPNVGERRFEAILEAYPNFLDLAYYDPPTIANYIRTVKGFKTLADEIAIRMREFADWLKAHPMITIEQPAVALTMQMGGLTLGGTQELNVQRPGTTLTIMQAAPPTQTQTLAGMTIVFSGKRHADMETRIKARGGKIGTAVSRNTSIVVLDGPMKGKGEKAQELGIPVVTPQQFEDQYL